MRLILMWIVVGFGASFGDGWFESLMVGKTRPYGKGNI